jgi:hypothetical protein
MNEDLLENVERELANRRDQCSMSLDLITQSTTLVM